MATRQYRKFDEDFKAVPCDWSPRPGSRSRRWPGSWASTRHAGQLVRQGSCGARRWQRGGAPYRVFALTDVERQVGLLGLDPRCRVRGLVHQGLRCCPV